MSMTRHLAATAAAVVLTVSGACLSLPATTPAVAQAFAWTSNLAVGKQYDTAHVYVAPENFDRFVESLLANFGGTASKQGVFTVTPTPSSTMSQLVLTPVTVAGRQGCPHPSRPLREAGLAPC
jgi:hypothetical protein